jgi:hypothetical protein
MRHGETSFSIHGVHDVAKVAILVRDNYQKISIGSQPHYSETACDQKSVDRHAACDKKHRNRVVSPV